MIWQWYVKLFIRIAIKCKNLLMTYTTPNLNDKFQRIESIAVALSIYPMKVPFMIDKGGEKKKQLCEMNSHSVHQLN